MFVRSRRELARARAAVEAAGLTPIELTDRLLVSGVKPGSEFLEDLAQPPGRLA